MVPSPRPGRLPGPRLLRGGAVLCVAGLLLLPGAGCTTPAATGAPPEAGPSTEGSAADVARRLPHDPVAPAGPRGASADERAMFALVNRDRGVHGLPPLTWDDRLAAIALAHDDDMLRRHYVAHVSPDGVSPAGRLRKAGYLNRVVRENIAVAASVPEAEVGLMHSPEHRANLLAPDITRVGIGIRRVPLKGGPTEVVVTQDFARPYTAPSPQAARHAALLAIGTWRRQARLPPLPVVPVLQRLGDAAVRHLAIGIDAARLHDVAQDAASAVERGQMPGIAGVAVASERILDLSDLRVPEPARDPNAVGLAVATTRARGDDGQPRVLVLVLVGQGR